MGGDGLVFVALSDSSLAILDVRDPNNPQQVSRLQTIGAHDIVVSHGIAYLAGFLDGLQLIDVREPGNPRPVGSYLDGLAIMDVAVSDPTKPRRISGYGTQMGANSLAIEGQIAHLASDGDGALHVVDVRNPDDPKRIGTYRAIGSARDVAVSGRFAYITHEIYDSLGHLTDGKLEVIDITLPANPTRLNEYAAGGWAYGVVVTDNTVYLASGAAGLLAITVGDQGSVTRVGEISSGAEVRAVSVSGRYACIVEYEIDSGVEWLQVVDVANPTHPQWAGRYQTGGSSWAVQSVGDVAYLANGMDGLLVIDVSDAANPQIMARCYIGGNATDVEVSGTVAYVATSMGGVRVVHVSDPVNPGLVGGNSAFTANALLPYGNHLLVAAGSDGLIILNKYTELRIGPAIVLSDGRVQLQLTGASGQGVRVQRSANLVDWEDWRTVTLDGTGCELIDETTATSHRFYRAVEDNSVATK